MGHTLFSVISTKESNTARNAWTRLVREESSMKIKIGVMGQAGETAAASGNDALAEKAHALARAIAARDLLLLTGATTGLVYIVGKAAHEAGIFHVGMSPAANMV